MKIQTSTNLCLRSTQGEAAKPSFHEQQLGLAHWEPSCCLGLCFAQSFQRSCRRALPRTPQMPASAGSITDNSMDVLGDPYHQGILPWHWSRW